MSSTKDECGCLQGKDGAVKSTQCPLHRPSTKDHLHVCRADDPNRVCLDCGEANPTPQATKPELKSVSPKQFGEAFFKPHDEATKPVDEQINQILQDFMYNATPVNLSYLKGEQEARQALKALLTEARINEVKALLAHSVEHFKQYERPNTRQKRIHGAVNKPLIDRLAQLKNERSNK